DISKDQLLEHMNFFHKKPKPIIVFVTVVGFVDSAASVRCACPQDKVTGAREGAKVIEDVNLESPSMKPSGANS
ncbi:hypothetical protein PanWU01x14_191880, partial [Parasponia andersonii]